MTAEPGTCPACSRVLPEDSLFCPTCGAATPTRGGHQTGGGGDTRRQQLANALGENFRVEELVGRGGFAEVYRVTDLELQRDIAVKVLRSDFGPSEEMAERFKREAQIVARLRHPGVIPIYSVGKTGDLLYFSMPLVEGETLRDLLVREKRIPPDEVLRILREAASALEAAHSVGLFHRDIKPENIMLEGRARRVLIMDFGIAKAAESQGEALTQTGMIIGTPQYMSPEQASGERNVDQRTDIYSLGVITYQMLCGRLPFEGANIQQVIAQHITSQAPELATLQPGLPPALTDIVHRCLNKAPDDRWNTVSDLMTALDEEFGPRLDETLSTSASLELPVEFGEKKRGEWIALGVAGVVGLVAFVASMFVLPASVDLPTITTAEADSIVDELLPGFGATGAYDRDFQFVTQGDRVSFLVEAVGRDSARALLQNAFSVNFWRFKWYRAGRPDYWLVEIGGNGELHLMSHPLVESAEGAYLDPDSARAIAGQFLADLGWDMTLLEPVSENTNRRPMRTDHNFGWEVVGSGIEKIAEGDTVSARQMVNLLVSGDVVTNYHHYLDVDDPPSGDSSLGSMIFGLFLVGLLATALLVVMRALRNRVVNWRHPIVMSAVVGSTVAAINLNTWSLGMDLDPAQTTLDLVADNLVLLIVLVALTAMLGLVLAGASLVLPRKLAPEALLGYETLFTRTWDRDLLRKVLGAGYAGGCAIALGMAASNFGYLIDLDANPSATGLGFIDMYVPGLQHIGTAILGALAAVTIGLILIGLVMKLDQRFSRKPTTAVKVALGLGVGALAIDIFDVFHGDFTDLMSISVLIGALILVRFGAVALIVSTFVAVLLSAAGGQLVGGHPDLLVPGIVSLVGIGIPLALARLGTRRPRGAA